MVHCARLATETPQAQRARKAADAVDGATTPSTHSETAGLKVAADQGEACNARGRGQGSPPMNSGEEGKAKGRKRPSAWNISPQAPRHIIPATELMLKSPCNNVKLSWFIGNSRRREAPEQRHGHHTRQNVGLKWLRKQKAFEAMRRKAM